MDISLDDFPYPAFDKDDPHEIPNSHYYYGDFGEKLLGHESRSNLRNAMRERAPAYRKERREYVELWIKGAAAIIGLLGAATGFIAVFIRSNCDHQ